MVGGGGGWRSDVPDGSATGGVEPGGTGVTRLPAAPGGDPPTVPSPCCAAGAGPTSPATGTTLGWLWSLLRPSSRRWRLWLCAQGSHQWRCAMVGGGVARACTRGCRRVYSAPPWLTRAAAARAQQAADCNLRAVWMSRVEMAAESAVWRRRFHHFCFGPSGGDGGGCCDMPPAMAVQWLARGSSGDPR